ncbi:hypothetical protein ACFWIA_28660 [Streptomyces sp. NPDC127068]|uniref:hypothetical protein n=1 Tax=Streptomyces sp. NPDC127068 TaxID=3347127 RepID=UPI00365EF952
MGVMVRCQELEVEVDHYGFAFQDVDDTVVPVEYPEGRGSGALLTEFPGRLDVESAGHTHVAAMLVEVWDAEPVAQPVADWDDRGDAEIVLASGELAVWGVTAGPLEETLRLSDGPGRWAVRLYVRGRAEVARLAQEGVPVGVERYLVQVWPTEA